MGARARHSRKLCRFRLRDLGHRGARRPTAPGRPIRRSRTGTSTTSSTRRSRRRGIPPETAAEAEAIARHIAERLDLVGVLAVEMFVTKTGELVVNELAPRPHNSGHWTIDACVTSQFEQLVRAICGLPLGSTEHHSDAVMTNLIGRDVEKWRDALDDPRRQAAPLRQDQGPARPQDGPRHPALPHGCCRSARAAMRLSPPPFGERPDEPHRADQRPEDLDHDRREIPLEPQRYQDQQRARAGWRPESASPAH